MAFVNDQKSIKAALRYEKLSRQYREACARGEGTYGQFSRLVQMHMNMIFPVVRGFHRDHIIPKSFCRKLGLSVSQTNHPDNLKYILPSKNIDKWSFLGPDELKHLKKMCEVWSIPYPSKKMIDDHNDQSQTKRDSLHNVNM